MGKFEEASAYFVRAVDNNSYDATAHYYLGNCLVALKDYTRAAMEYQGAIELTDDSKMADYCRKALANLKPYTAPKPLPVAAEQAKNDVSVLAVAARSNKVKAILDRSKNDARQIMQRAEERCRPILEEKKSTLQTMSIKLRGKVETTTSEEREDVTKDYERQIESIRRLAKAQADGVLQQGRRDAAAVGQGLPNLDEVLRGQ